jgi:hypothetical protein
LLAPVSKSSVNWAAQKFHSTCCAQLVPELSTCGCVLLLPSIWTNYFKKGSSMALTVKERLQNKCSPHVVLWSVSLDLVNFMEMYSRVILQVILYLSLLQITSNIILRTSRLVIEHLMYWRGPSINQVLRVFVACHL